MRALFATIAVTIVAAGAQPRVLRHVMVYQEPGRFGGWPANHGIWSWGDEILVGFSAAYFQHKSPDRHQYDNSKPEEPRLARSLDGGETWTVEAPPSLLPPEQGGSAVSDLTVPMDFLNPGFAMTLRFTDSNKGPSRLRYSLDRGKTWRGPYRFPLFGRQGIMARTDYIVNGEHDAFVFLTASKSNAREGRVLCARTSDGGLTWRFVSWIGAEPEGFSIMPSSVRLSASKLLTATRVHQGAANWIDLYASDDDAATWRLLERPVPSTGAFGGNPPSLIRLRDGRLCLTYGYRSPPYGIRARLSRDEGRSWSDDIVLRADCATWELGYTRSIQRRDRKIVTVYYYAPSPNTERAVAATIWDPGK